MSSALTIPNTLSPLPLDRPDSSQLLTHFLARTANTMGNGSTDANPFIVQLIPLAFSHELILDLVLTQSAVHRAVSELAKADDTANEHYRGSLRLFRKHLSRFTGDSGNTMILAAAALIMCFTETAKGDINGAVFRHLVAARHFLREILARESPSMTYDLKTFLVEYYIYSATTSIISVEPRSDTQFLLSPEIESFAQHLTTIGYVGHLCGCWMDLLLLIPQIFELGRKAFPDNKSDQVAFPTADDMIVFSNLHARIVSYSPYGSVSSETATTGYIYQQAMLLYLLTCLNGLEAQDPGKYRSMVAAAISEAASHILQLPATARVNTSLCWPLAVIGACVADSAIQDVLRTRLQFMLQTLGLGNVRQTARLLEHIWEMPLSQRSPWTIYRTMQENQIWISFA
ncbi:hypothetical protein A1O1_05053 [Capronia coronata CBS 617.96]|uniref:C6 transcription factor n=1 Tax=Capronia coronata CBS 617.96 TaxID=1182541 RepID=W9YEM8_9EURO|nr:uncharacterized protein A1O1_05053 [Capronia coronata CBS 617.96]EXJ88125.1 hypothetical protein A1O1_05053 [Capronia coronata CBS 617.96]